MLVTCYYNIYNRPAAFMEYFLLFHPMGMSGLPITVFVEPVFAQYFEVFPPTVKVVPLPYEELELYNRCMGYNCKLPSERNMTKDTKEYLSLMNTKVEFIKRAAELCEDETLIWADFGILKSISDVDAFIARMRILNGTVFDRVTLPGGWKYGTAFWPNQCNWRFNGNMCIVPRKHATTFFEYCRTSIQELFESQGFLVWEISIWYLVELYKSKEMIQWYKAAHDDSVIQNVPLPAAENGAADARP